MNLWLIGTHLRGKLCRLMGTVDLELGDLVRMDSEKIAHRSQKRAGFRGAMIGVMGKRAGFRGAMIGSRSNRDGKRVGSDYGTLESIEK